MSKDKEEDLMKFWRNLLDNFFITMLSQMNNKVRIVRSTDNILAEVNRAKRAKRELKQVVEYYFRDSKDRQYIKYNEVCNIFFHYLGNNIPLSREVKEKLKFPLDYTKRSKRERQWIRWHAVAQLIGLEDPRKKVFAIKKEILGDHRLDHLLEFGTLPSLSNPEKKLEDRFREIENAIGEVVKWGVGRPAKGAQSKVVVSPLVYSEGKVNFQALLEAMSAVGSALKIWGRPLRMNYVSSVVELYKKALPDSPVIDVFIYASIGAFYNRLGKGKYFD